MSDPTTDQTPIDIDAIEIISEGESADTDDDSTASPADEEMSGEPDEDDEDDDDDASLEDDDETQESETDADDEDDLQTRRKADAYDELQRRLAYQQQQQKNQQYWDGIESQAANAFQAKYDQIFTDAQNYVDPDGYVRTKVAEWTREVTGWVKDFESSKNVARARAQEQSSIPVYAAKLATHYKLSIEQAHELLEYHPQQMDKEAQRRAQSNAREASLKKKARQTQRADARNPLAKNPLSTGSGKSGPIRVKAGSDNHLLALFAAAQQGKSLT